MSEELTPEELAAKRKKRAEEQRKRRARKKLGLTGRAGRPAKYASDDEEERLRYARERADEDNARRLDASRAAKEFKDLKASKIYKDMIHKLYTELMASESELTVKVALALSKVLVDKNSLLGPDEEEKSEMTFIIETSSKEEHAGEEWNPE